VCIGATLAMTETILILAVLAQRFRLRLKEGEKVTLQTRITLRPKNGMMTILERREPAAQSHRGLEPPPQQAAIR
jgi:cytochrome P450